MGDCRTLVKEGDGGSEDFDKPTLIYNLSQASWIRSEQGVDFDGPLLSIRSRHNGRRRQHMVMDEFQPDCNTKLRRPADMISRYDNSFTIGESYRSLALGCY